MLAAGWGINPRMIQAGAARLGVFLLSPPFCNQIRDTCFFSQTKPARIESIQITRLEGDVRPPGVLLNDAQGNGRRLSRSVGVPTHPDAGVLWRITVSLPPDAGDLPRITRLTRTFLTEKRRL
jgi:hypothetical protein